MEKLPIKKRHLLIVGTALLLLACYRFAFKPTLEAWQLYGRSQKQLATASDLSVQPAYLERKSRNLEQVIRNYQLDSVAFRNKVLNTVAELAEQHKVKLTGVPTDEAIYHTGELIVQRVDLEGDFFDLLKLVDTVQHTRNTGVLRSASWKFSRTFGATEGKRLGLELYFQIYRKKDQ